MENLPALIPPAHIFPMPLPRSLLLVIAPHAARPLMLELAARTALTGALRVLDGGNQFNVYPVAHEVRRYTADLYAALERIQVARAFTCYQMAALLEQSGPQAQPTLVLDLLSTFYDEDVRIEEASQLLKGCLVELRRLAQAGPLVVSARQPPEASADRAARMALLNQLRATAAQVWEA